MVYARQTAEERRDAHRIILYLHKQKARQAHTKRGDGRNACTLEADMHATTSPSAAASTDSECTVHTVQWLLLE